MKNIIVPTDFSQTAKNCARYAIEFAKFVQADRLILFNAYSMPLATEMSWAIIQTEELQKMSEDSLEAEKVELQALAPGLRIDVVSEFGFLQDTIQDVVEEHKVDLIIMGISGGGKLEEVLIGSNTTHMVHEVDIPVIIVPPQAKWQPVEKIGWANDFKKAMQTSPVEKIRKFVHLLHAQLIVVYNDKGKDFSPEVLHGNVQVQEIFKELNPQYIFTREDDFKDAMDAFVEENHIDMLILIPRKQSWLSSVFSRSHTKSLAFHTHVPMFCVKEKR